jgi:hypothetical protein
VLFTGVQVALLSFGGAGYLPRADTAPPSVIADVPRAAPSGEPIRLAVTATDEVSGERVFITWTIDGSFIGSATALELSSGLAPGEYTWAVYARDPAGNTASRSGLLEVTPVQADGGSTLTMVGTP